MIPRPVQTGWCASANGSAIPASPAAGRSRRAAAGRGGRSRSDPPARATRARRLSRAGNSRPAASSTRQRQPDPNRTATPARSRRRRTRGSRARTECWPGSFGSSCRAPARVRGAARRDDPPVVEHEHAAVALEHAQSGVGPHSRAALASASAWTRGGRHGCGLHDTGPRRLAGRWVDQVMRESARRPPDPARQAARGDRAAAEAKAEVVVAERMLDHHDPAALPRSHRRRCRHPRRRRSSRSHRARRPPSRPRGPWRCRPGRSAFRVACERIARRPRLPAIPRLAADARRSAQVPAGAPRSGRRARRPRESSRSRHAPAHRGGRDRPSHPSARLRGGLARSPPARTSGDRHLLAWVGVEPAELAVGVEAASRARGGGEAVARRRRRRPGSPEHGEASARHEDADLRPEEVNSAVQLRSHDVRVTTCAGGATLV